MSEEKIIIICTECKTLTDSWELVSEAQGVHYGVCLNCIRDGMSPLDFAEMMKCRAEMGGIDRL